MPRRTNPFQHLITLIEATTHTDSTTVGESVELEDKITGQQREVDIVINVSGSTHPIIIGVECKGGGCNPRPASVEWVEQMWGKHTSLPTDKLILVAKGGFTESAKKKASWLGIECLGLEDAEKLDWSAKIRGLAVVQVIHFLQPHVTRATLILSEEAEKSLKENDINLDRPVLVNTDGEQVDALNLTQTWVSDPALIEYLEKNAFTDSGTVFEFERKLKNSVFIMGTSGTKYPVLAIKVEGKCRRVIEEVRLIQSTYGNTAVAHGATRRFNKKLQFLLTERKGDVPILVLSVSKSKRKSEEQT